MPKITKRLVDCLSPETEQRTGTRTVPDVFVWDDELRGFGVQVKPSGRRAYVVQYRRKSDGRSRRLTIGSHGRITAEQAREQAKILLGEVALGGDPLDKRRTVREEALRAAEEEKDTVTKVFAEFLDRHAKVRTRSWRETRRLFEKEVLPFWGDREIGTISRRDVITLLDTIMDRGAPYTANRVLAAVRKLFSWCLERGILDASPVVRIPKPGAETERDRVLRDDEIRTLWAAWEKQGWRFGPLFQLLLVTGQRRNEVAGMRWSDLDFENKVWRLPREDTKADRGHEVPLSPLAMEILEALPKMGELVFPNRRHGQNPVSGFSKAKGYADALCEMKIAAWRLHDLRRTCGTHLARLGVPRDIIKRVLNHSGGRDVTDIYDRHSYLPEKRRALDAWSSKLERLVRPGTADNVVPLTGSDGR